ncbi:MAG: PH domain-containing protein [Planctomycetota bacterium]
MSDHKILRTAEFDKAAMKKYYILGPVVPLVLTVIFIPIVPIIVLIMLLFVNKTINSLSCRLTDRTLEIKRGWLNRTESTVPLEKVTDLQMFQGPIMRWLGLHGFRVETAGQTSGATGGALVNLIGIVDAPAFRKAVLEQRDVIAGSVPAPAPASPAAQMASGDQAAVLAEIRDSLLRIEAKIGDRV